MTNQPRYGALALVLLICLVVLAIVWKIKTPVNEVNYQQKYYESIHHSDSLEGIIQLYEYVTPDSIKEYYEKEYQILHDSIDNNSVKLNAELLKRLLSNSDSI